MALIGWDSIYQPKSRGGLGLRYLQDQNISFLMKIGFNLVSKDNTLWLSDDVINRIVSIPPPHLESRLDRVFKRRNLESQRGILEAYMEVSMTKKNGEVARDMRNASAGGMLWDQLGNWILGFNRYLGKCSPSEAEALIDIKLEDSNITLLRRLHRTMRF
ncbi:hypothetical protein Goshw_008302 [Gossypium schwendimanii]|uniref:Uncharacterized protein n=1 Tax=Gossypium schwendimanii TaxID=34291 RepID=A0A7J9MIC4_GOSSC|nr:hypothetical protein [Gossypium schwendimanii]